MTAYYNDNDPGAAAWLRELMREGYIPEGEVDERSILDVEPADLAGFRQCHFFAGIGGWAYALRLAGWPDDRPVWTGSPPCQPFSVAGKGLARDDPRHLAPHFLELVTACRPPVLFGEQVASADVFGKAAKRAGGETCGAHEWAWIDDVSLHLEAAHYAFGAADLPAASVGAPHQRQRAFFGAYDLRLAAGGGTGHRIGGADPRRSGEHAVAAGDGAVGEPDSDGQHGGGNGRPGRRDELTDSGATDRLADADSRECNRLADSEGCKPDRETTGRIEGDGEPECSGATDRLEHPSGDGREQRRAEPSGRSASGGCGVDRLANTNGERRNGEQIRLQPRGPQQTCPETAGRGAVDRLADADDAGPQGRVGLRECADQRASGQGGVAVGQPATGPVNGFWRNADWLFSTDGKWRAVEPGSFPLAHGVPGRVALLRGAGNAIVPQLAAEFIGAFMEAAE